MQRPHEERALVRELDDAAEIHHRDAVGHVGDDREVVGDEQIRESALALQIAQQIHDLRMEVEDHIAEATTLRRAAAEALAKGEAAQSAADKALRQTCETLGMQGVSTHSFRRSFATSALRRGVDLPTIQRVTGHKSLGSLGHYLEVGEAEVLAAIEGA